MSTKPTKTATKVTTKTAVKPAPKSSPKKKIRVRISGADPRIIDHTAEAISDTAKSSGARVVAIPLPTKRQIYTVLRSPHVNVKSREQFEMRTHIRLIDIHDPTLDTIDKLKILPVAAGVDIKIKA